MPVSKELTGIILQSHATGERFVRWQIISHDEGFLLITAPPKIALPFGTFDKVELIANVKGKGLFAKEVRLINRPEGLAQNFAAFEEAGRLAKLMQSAFKEMPDYKPIYEIFEKALVYYSCCATGAQIASRTDALINSPGFQPWDSKAQPALITLKAFYKMLLAEGFPVAQDWLDKLPSKTKDDAKKLLAAPLPEVLHSLGEEELPSIQREQTKEMLKSDLNSKISAGSQEILTNLIAWASRELSFQLKD